MKGIVFVLFSQMVEEKMGLAALDRLLTTVSPGSGGAYTIADSYADKELSDLLGALSDQSGTPAGDLLRMFGAYCLPEFEHHYPAFFRHDTAKAFLESIHGVIHVEVKKLYPDAQLPSIAYEDPASDRLVMIYRSGRRLCRFAEGLIEACGTRFGTRIEWTHPRCLHNGDDHCRFELVFRPAAGGAGA